MQIEQGKIQLEQRPFSISKSIDDVIEVVRFSFPFFLIFSRSNS